MRPPGLHIAMMGLTALCARSSCKFVQGLSLEGFLELPNCGESLSAPLLCLEPVTRATGSSCYSDQCKQRLQRRGFSHDSLALKRSHLEDSLAIELSVQCTAAELLRSEASIHGVVSEAKIEKPKWVGMGRAVGGEGRGPAVSEKTAKDSCCCVAVLCIGLMKGERPS